MKRVLFFALTLLFLTGCSAESTSSTAAPSSPENALSEIVPPAITAEALREEYEKNGEFTVREIVPYEGDFLVYYGNDPYGGIFQWVYTDTGLRVPLLFSDREILSYEIIYPGRIRVLQGNTNLYNAALSFPTYQTASAALPVWSNGEIPTDLYASGSVQQETYWAPVSESHTWGWDHGEVALVDIRIGTGGIEAVFGPTADNLSGFFAAASSIPVTKSLYDEATHTLTLVFQNTTLTSGECTEFTDEIERDYYESASALYHLPTSFPAGTVQGSNDFISSAEVQQDGSNTLLILTLTEAAEQYTSDGGQLLLNESRPYLRLMFREEHCD